MEDRRLEDLLSQVHKRRVLAIVGAGVSIAATKGKPECNEKPLASWLGLLYHGVDYCVQAAGASEAWANAVRGQIALEDDDDHLILAATAIENKLKAPNGGLFRKWLRISVGSLTVADSSIIKALKLLNVPIATTNYDDLIEKVTRLPAITWKQNNEFEHFLRGEEKSVLHLHGHWKTSDSIVFGHRSYDAITRDTPAQALLRALFPAWSLLFIGCGTGLNDPNIGELLKWASEAFAGSEYFHYRLALKREIATLRANHPIYPLSYGDTHGELADFLSKLAPTARKRLPRKTGRANVEPPRSHIDESTDRQMDALPDRRPPRANTGQIQPSLPMIIGVAVDVSGSMQTLMRATDGREKRAGASS